MNKLILFNSHNNQPIQKVPTSSSNDNLFAEKQGTRHLGSSFLGEF